MAAALLITLTACTTTLDAPRVPAAKRTSLKPSNLLTFQEPLAPARMKVLPPAEFAKIAPPSLATLGVEVVAGVSVPAAGNPYRPRHLYGVEAQGGYLVFATDFGAAVPANLVASEASNYGYWGTIRLADGAIRIRPDPVPGGVGLVQGEGPWLVFREEFFHSQSRCRFVSEPDGCRSWTMTARSVTSSKHEVLAASTKPQDFAFAPLPVISGDTVAWTQVSPTAPMGQAPGTAYVCTLPHCKTRSYPVANGTGFDYLPGNGQLWVQSPTSHGDSMLHVDLATGQSAQWMGPLGDANLTPGTRWIAFSRPSGQNSEMFIAAPTATGLGPPKYLATVSADYGTWWLSPSVLLVSTITGYTLIDAAVSPAKSVSWNANFDYEVSGTPIGNKVALAVRQPDGSEALLVLRATS